MRKFLNAYQSVFGVINYVAFVLVLVSLAFPWHFTQPLFAVWLVTWLLEGRWTDKTNFSFSRHTMSVLLMGGFVVWEALSLLWTQDLNSGISELERHLPIFVVILMTLFGGNKYYQSYKLKTALLIGCLLALLSYSMIVYWCSITKVLGSWTINYWTFFGEGPIEYIKHRQYLCIALLLALCFSGDIYRHYVSKYPKYACMTFIGLADLILIAAIVMTGSRTTILLLPILGMIYILRVLPGRYKWFFASGLIAVVIAAGAILPRYNWRFESMKKDVVALFTAHQDPATIHEPRALIWTTVIRHSDDFGWFGLGTGSSDEFLQKCYQEEQIDMHYGSHNNYLYFFMELGWFGLIYFIGMLIAIPFFHTGGARRDATMACIIFGWSMMAENLMTMMSGLYIFFAAIIIIQCLQRESNSQLPSRP